jgi:FMN reductase
MSQEALKAVAVSGSPGRHSKSRQLLGHAVDLLNAENISTELVDLALVPADGLLGRAPSEEVTTALRHVADANIVVASTPVYRATYSGLLKVFFDLLPPSGLAGKVAIPIATGGSANHQLVLDYGLRPLFGSVGATVVPSATYAYDAQFTAYGPDPLVLLRLERAVAEAVSLARATNRSLTPVL